MADLIKIIKSDLYDYRGSVDGNKYGESYDITVQTGFSDPTLEKAGGERILKVNGSLFYTGESAHYACGLEKAFGVNHQDVSMTAVSDYNDAMSIACLEDGQLIFDKQSNIIANYLNQAYGAITGLGLLLNGQPVNMRAGFSSQGSARSGRTIIGMDKDGNYLSYSFAGTTGSSGLTGPQAQQKCLELGFYNAIMLDGGGSVFREYLRSYDISTTRQVKNALILYRKRKANPFIPRASKTIPSDLTYTDAVTNGNKGGYEDIYNAGATDAVCLPNCTTYAMGRSGEIADKSCRDYEILNRTGFPDASGGYSVAKGDKGQTPKVGAIACGTDNGKGGGGHVAVVEETDGTNKGTYLSMSGYQNASSGTRSFTNPGKDASGYFKYLEFDTTNYYYTTYDNRGGTFLGYLYNPYVGELATLPEGVARNQLKDQVKLNANVTLKVRLDPSTNAKTLGTIKSNDLYYDVLSSSEAEGYTGYQIGKDSYVADNGSWLTLYPAETPSMYTVTLAASPVDGGTVEGSGQYEAGITCILRAIPATDYVFNSGSDGNKDNPRSIEITSDINLIANFDYVEPAIKYKVNASVSPAAAATAGCYIVGTGEYEANTVVTLTAIALGGYKFDSGSDGQTTGSISINVTKDINVVANFSINSTKYTVTTECDYDDFGTMTGAGEYASGELVTVSAQITNPKYKFNCGYLRYAESPSIPITINQDTYTFNCYNNCTFTLDLIDTSKYRTVTLHVNNAEYGSVTGAGTFQTGTSITISATAKSGYMFTKGSDGNTLATRSIVLTDNLDLTAYFAKSSQSADIVRVTGEATVTANLPVEFVNYNKNYSYKFYGNKRVGGTITSETIQLLVNNDFEEALPNTSKGTFYLDVEALDSDGDVRAYQRDIPFIVNIPDTFGVTIEIVGSEGSVLFNNVSVAGFSTGTIKYKVTQSAPPGYTNHSPLGRVEAVASGGNITPGSSQVIYRCSNSSADYTASLTLNVRDGRRSASANGTQDIKGYDIPAYRLRKLELQEATSTKYNCFIAFDISVLGEKGGNEVQLEDIIINVDGKDYKNAATGDDFNGGYSAVVGDELLDKDLSHTISVTYRDKVLAVLSPTTGYVAVQSISNKLPISLYDDTAGTVGVSFGEQSKGENIIKLGMETTFGSDVKLNASKHDNQGKLLQVSKDAYDLLNGDGDAMVRGDSTNGKYANRIACMTGDEYSALAKKEDNVLYFLTSVPNT